MVLDSLTPAERLALVLRDVFAMPFDEIAPVVARLDGCAIGPEHDVRVEHRERRGEVTVARGSEEGLDDGSRTAEVGLGCRGGTLHPATRAALVDGAPGAVWATRGQPRVVFVFAVTGSTIVAIDLSADVERLRRIDLTELDRPLSRQ